MEQFLPLLIAGAMIVFMITSSRKRKAQAAEMASKVAVGATVMLSSGIYGEITSVSDDRIVLKSAGSTTLEVAKGAVVRVVDNAPEKKVAAKAAKPAAKKPAAKK
ncbi:MAG: hypothetical protein RL166_639 [Actinomycetota bacterium]|jgi:preprotein translocase subunit YajC